MPQKQTVVTARKWLLLTGLILLVGIGFWLLSTKPKIAAVRHSADVPFPAYEAPSDASAQIQTEDGFLLRLTDGQLAVYPAGSSQPVQLLEAEPSLYSELDRTLLEAGIFAADEAALRRLIEDYTS